MSVQGFLHLPGIVKTQWRQNRDDLHTPDEHIIIFIPNYLL